MLEKRVKLDYGAQRGNEDIRPFLWRFMKIDLENNTMLEFLKGHNNVSVALHNIWVTLVQYFAIKYC